MGGIGWAARSCFSSAGVAARPSVVSSRPRRSLTQRSESKRLAFADRRELAAEQQPLELVELSVVRRHHGPREDDPLVVADVRR